MSRGTQFGVTPWGKAVKEKIVSSGGRLDRGLSIARSKDKVFDTHVQGNVVTTKVRGNNRPFYNVRSEWRRLSGQDKRMVLTMVRSNLLWLGRILNGDLPLELLSALEKAGIALLPKNLKEMGTSCNCPDAAGYRYRGAAALRAGQVCKHQAALIFAIVAEIDKDAFQLFKLRGLDLVRELSGNNEVERDAVTGIQNRLLLTSAPEVLTLEHPEEDDVIVLDASDVECDSDVEILDTHTLDAPRKTRLPLRAPKLQNHAKFLLSCLPKSPAFSTRVDFKIVLEQFYAYVNRKKTATLLREELDWEKPILAKDENGSSPLEILESGLRRSSFELHLDPGFCIERATFSVRGECFRSHRMSKVISLLPGAKLDGDCFTVGACILLRVLSKTKDIHVGPSPSYLYFRNIVRASHWLFLRNACVPSVVPTSQNTRSWRALFVPFTGQEGQPIAELIRSLVELYPENNPVQLQKRALSKEAGTEQALGLLMTKLVHSIKFLPRGAANKAPKLITSALFQGEVFQPLTLRDQGTGAAVQRWFGVLDLFKLNVDVEMRLDYGRDGAYNLTLQLKKANRAGRFVSARDFFAKGLTQPVHFSAIRFLASIETFLPGNAKALLSRGRTRLSEADFETFLLDQTPLLKALGIQLVLPKQMSKVHVPRMVVLARLRKKGLVDEEDIDEEDYDEDDCKAMHLPYLKVKQLVDFDASIAIGDTVITMEEFEALVRQGRRVMRYKDKYIHVTPEQALKLLQQARQRQIELDEGVAVPTALDLMRASLGKDYKSLVWLDKGVNDQMKKLFTSDKIGHPKGMNCTLRPYQITGFEWLVATTTKMGGALLADDMGLGKTIQSIAVLHYQKSLGRLSPQKPALVVAPTSLMANWASEIARFAPGISTNVYCGPKRDLGNKTDVILTTYTTACKDLAKLGQLDLSIMVIDEAQNIKNHWTKTAKSIKQLGKKKTIMRIALTGTPVENRLAELHSIFEFILPGWFPSLKQFHSEYAMPIQQYGDPEAVVMLKMMTAPFLMRRLKTELLSELPPKIMNNRLVCLSKEQASLYEALVEDTIEKLHEIGLAKKRKRGERRPPQARRKGMLILRLIGALKQICNHPACYENRGAEYDSDYRLSGKCKVLVEELLPPILQKGEKVLIFSQYVRFAQLLMNIFRDELTAAPLLFHGGLSRPERENVLKLFRTDPARQILILSLKAGGVGLNLTCANHVIHADRWWNRSVEEQAEDRAFRIGQTQTVVVHRFITKNSFEERINEMIMKKEELSNLAVEAGESWIAKLDDEELADLFTIRRVAEEQEEDDDDF